MRKLITFTAPTPIAFTADTISPSTVRLNWSLAVDSRPVDYYKIYRNGTLIGTSLTTTYDDTTATATHNYTYGVSSVINYINESTQVTVVDNSVVPLIPTNLTATVNSGTQITLTWSATTVSGGTISAYVLRRDGVIVNGSANALSYINTGLTQNTTYSYTISAIDNIGNESEQSLAITAKTFDTAAPSVPTGLTATAVSPTQINLSWNPSNDNVGVTGYKLYRGATLINGSSSATSYSNTGLTASTLYSYTVSAFDARNNTSAASAAASATTPGVIPPPDSAIQGFAAVAGVTGGGTGGTVYTVTSNLSSGTGTLYDYLNRAGARTIKFTQGLTAIISMPPASVSSPFMYLQNGNVTLDGDKANITITGASINTNGKTNIIIKNMTFTDNLANGSAVQISYGSYNVWVDHCTFSGQSSGSKSGQPIAVWNQSSTGLDGTSSELTGITLSWNHFKAPNSRAVLAGGETHNTGNTVVLPIRISMHHNYYDNCTTRNPRAHSKGVTIHEWNSYATASWSEAPVTVTQGAAYYGQGNIYQPLGTGTKTITNNSDFYFPTDGPIGIKSEGHYLLNSATINQYGTFPMDRITYTATVETANDALKARIIAYAGANKGV